MSPFKMLIGLAATLLLTACITSTEYDRDLAYASCQTGTGDALKVCMQREMADRSSDRQAYAEQYREELAACEERRTLAAARGAGAENISCNSNLADYVLGGAVQ